MKMIGVFSVPSSARNCRATSLPSMPGISMSSNTRSGLKRRAAVSAPRGSLTSHTSNTL